MSEMIQIQSNQNEIIQFDSRFKNLSQVIFNILEDSQIKEIIPMQLSSEILKLIQKYCEIHDYSPPIIYKPVRSIDLEKYVGAQNNKYIKNINHDKFIELFEAANYLVMQSLIDLCSCKLATDIYFDPSSILIENYFKENPDIEKFNETKVCLQKTQFPYFYKNYKKHLDLNIK